MKLTRKQAIELSIKKWEWIVENNGKELTDKRIIPELAELENDCALCEKYLDTSGSTLYECYKCPIRPNIKDYDDLLFEGCSQDCHPWSVWFDDNTKENAQKVLDLIKSKL